MVISYKSNYESSYESINRNLEHLNPSTNQIDNDIFNQDLYIEQIGVDLFPNGSLIHNARLDVNPYILNNIDWNLPQFQGISLILLQQSQILPSYAQYFQLNPSLFPSVENYSLIGGIYINYHTCLKSPNQIQPYLIDLFKSYLGLELYFLPILENNNGRFIPFVGYNNYQTTTQNQLFSDMFEMLPQNGIFSSLHSRKTQIFTPTFIKTNYFSQNLFVLENWTLIKTIQDMILDKVENEAYPWYHDFYQKMLQNPIAREIEYILTKSDSFLTVSKSLSIDNKYIVETNQQFSSFLNPLSLKENLNGIKNLILFDFVYEGKKINQNSLGNINSPLIHVEAV
jgi:hypothetical protein